MPDVPHMRLRIVRLGLILVLGIACVPACGASWSGKCVGVSDGDTISVMRHGKATKIRLYGIDCPERGQDFGSAARKFTSRMVFGKTVRVREVDKDSYGRTVAWVWVDGASLNKELVKAGLAWWYKHFAPGETELKELEKKARSEKIGLWSHPKPIPPWEFRKSSWKRSKTKWSAWRVF